TADLQGGGDGDSARSRTHLEVLWIHVQLVAVQLTQVGEGGLDVVQVLHSVPEGGQHLLAVGVDLGVVQDGVGAGEVPEGREEPLGPGIDDQVGPQGLGLPGQGFATNFLHIDLGPQGDNVVLLIWCELPHGDEIVGLLGAAAA
uniref:Uncharacterized protein n=1 Tax=Pelusios castaneus TaxID=367368 RepID=A0A8C8RDK7_9SAUR